MKQNPIIFLFLVIPFLLSAEIPFKIHRIVDGEADLWWARSHADVNKDGLIDFFVINRNGHGGWLAWYETQPDFGPSVRHMIAEKSPEGGTFAAGSLTSGDINGDGLVDVIGPVSPGEWDGGKREPITVYWYENPTWEPRLIGGFPSFVKDFNLADLNGDGKLDLVATTHFVPRMIVYRQDDPNTWTKVCEVAVDELHEGQDVGDVDGDGDLDVIATGFWFVNPGKDMTGTWEVRNVDPFWNSDAGRGWQHNATKIYCTDMDEDEIDEVFISCSERFRNRIAWYDYNASAEKWTAHEIGLMSYGHTLQVGDIDLDGDLDVLSGNNRDQGWPDISPMAIFLNPKNDSDGRRFWGSEVLTLEGSYNSFLVDVEGDGDLDIFRYPGHEGTFYELWENKLR